MSQLSGNLPYDWLCMLRNMHTIAGYCKQLMMGGFDEALKGLREQASRQVS